jgi:chromosome segregation ATPase
VAPEQPAAPDDAKTIGSRNLVTAWLTEGQRLVHAVPTLLRQHDQLKARAEAAERKCERCEGEIKSLRDENEHFRRERRQTAENLKALTKHLLESAGGASSVRS